jgi:ABC-type nitrate/sulfonate/bicarbonate transport system ATPase subunit/ABC-type nitrate/sulfonate/bicarbonate transport system permease component
MGDDDMTASSERWRMIRRATVTLLAAASLYEAMAQSGLFPAVLLPTLPKVGCTLLNLIGDGTMLRHASYTLARVMVGFALAIVVGLPLGILMARFRAVENFVMPLASALMPIPSLAWVPVFILWFGLGDTVTILIVFYAAMFPMLLNTWTGVRAVNPLWLRAAGAMGADEGALFWKVIIPGASPFIITGLRQAFLRSWIAVVGAEMLAASDWGLGWVIFDAKEFLNTDVMMASLAVIGGIGYAFERLVFGSLERVTVLRWGMVRAATERGRAAPRSCQEAAMSDIEIRDVSLIYDTPSGPVQAIDGASIRIASSEFLCIVGPSGCGKSTLLNIIAGFLAPTSGEIRIGDRPVTGRGMDRGVVFQDFAQLFPWRTALGNVTFGLEMKGVGREEREKIALGQLALVKLEKFAHSYPHHLSGGMQQRVAIARALAYNPSVLLMDEPFAALDALTRDAMQRLLAEVWRATRKTVVYVTHNVAEAVYLADRVVVMTPHPGRVKIEIPIALPRPRDPLSVEFLQCQKDLLRHLGNETGAPDAPEICIDGVTQP